MQIRRHAAAAAALLIGITASCSDSPSAPSDRPGRDLSTAVAQTITVAFGTYFPGGESVDIPAACPYSAAAGTYVCAPAAIGAYTYVLSYSLLDADGRSLSAPSERAVTMRAVIDRSGRRTTTADDGDVTTDVADHREMLVTGLQSGTRTFSGTATARYETKRNVPGAPRTVQDVTGTTTNIVFEEGALWPRSGTLTSSEIMTVLPSGGTPPTTSHSVVEFDGTSVVTLIMSVGASTLHCKYDLAGHVATTCS